MYIEIVQYTMLMKINKNLRDPEENVDVYCKPKKQFGRLPGRYQICGVSVRGQEPPSDLKWPPTLILLIDATALLRLIFYLDCIPQSLSARFSPTSHSNYYRHDYFGTKSGIFQSSHSIRWPTSILLQRQWTIGWRVTAQILTHTSSSTSDGQLNDWQVDAYGEDTTGRSFDWRGVSSAITGTMCTRQPRTEKTLRCSRRRLCCHIISCWIALSSVSVN